MITRNKTTASNIKKQMNNKTNIIISSLVTFLLIINIIASTIFITNLKDSNDKLKANVVTLNEEVNNVKDINIALSNAIDKRDIIYNKNLTELRNGISANQSSQNLLQKYLESYVDNKNASAIRDINLILNQNKKFFEATFGTKLDRLEKELYKLQLKVAKY
jgi:hypothetical protein